MKRAVVTLLLVAAAFLGGYVFHRSSAGAPAAEAGKKSERKILYWHDPMHPAYKSDKPGIAPDCGMKLEPVYADGGAMPAGEERKVLFYRDPHAPQYRSDKPGLNPETGNELEAVYADDGSGLPSGSVRVPAEKQQLIGVRYAEVETTQGSESIRAVGKVAFDETRLHHIHSRTDGWIERVHVNFEGDLVRKGQPLLTLYSPELLASQQEYLVALKARDVLGGSTVRDVASNNRAMVDAARRRLQLWNMTDEQIAELERTGKPKASVTLYSDSSGYVMKLNAFHNQRVAPETELYTIVDLSRVWVLASVFEYDAVSVRVGQPAVVTVPYLNNRKISARVAYIQPQLDAQTRTLQVRLELPNPGFALKPEMFVDVDLAVKQTPRITVPSEAVLDSGAKKTVFVTAGQGWFEPREVEAGQRVGDRIEILKGLKSGERIVASGVFLLNSESQLKAAASNMGAPAATGHEGHAAPPAPAQPTPAKPEAEGHRHD
ncbi:MAG TPA: efflux RND transporter periplasmic adaptor subunit [Bryobacteraceae bacterium]|nr:efflux RND transporter periplasmic adaptor subunit [Bryobacteraceae bacterium]